MKHLFLMDPIEDVVIDKDSTFALMCEAQKRDQEVFYAQVDDLYQRGGNARCLAQKTTLTRVQGQHAALGPVQDLHLNDVDMVWMRKDPPFHMGYINNTYLLDLAEAETLVVNAPSGLRAMNEKAWAMRFPELVPDSMITQSITRLRAFAEELGAIVVKPLDGNGGEGVFIVRSDDPNIGVILEISTQHGQRKVIAQTYLPRAREGDKRVILVDGTPVGAMLRIPNGVDHRGNMHVGATVAPCDMDANDLAICARIGPFLKEAGQIFVGIDVIGGRLTEVNVTSPTGIHEINAFNGVSVEAMLLDAAEARLAAR